MSERRKPAEGKLRALVESNRDDHEIAAIYGVASSTVAGWRQSYQIFRPWRTSREANDLLRELFEAGRSDSEIADHLEITTEAVQRRRVRQGLRRRDTPGGPVIYEQVPAYEVPSAFWDGRRLAQPGQPAAWDQPGWQPQVAAPQASTP